METQQQLSFQFENAAIDSKNPVANVIYITNDINYNKLSLQIVLDNGAITLNPASDIIPPSELPPQSSQGTLIYIDLSTLNMDETSFNQLSFINSAWRFQSFPESQVVGMTPLKPISLTAGVGGIQSINVSNLKIVTPPLGPTVILQAQVYDIKFPHPYTSFKVALQNPPDQKDKNLQDYIQIELLNNNIINTPLTQPPTTNKLELSFKPGAYTTQIVAGDNTIFNISFVYGKTTDNYGYGALTSVSNAENIEITGLFNADKWISTSMSSKENPSWNLVPPAGVPIVGSGISSVVTFCIDKIITTYQPGPTVMLITYQNVPGCQDGVYTLLLNKIAHVVIKNLKVNPNPTYVQDGKAPVALSWDVENATSLSLSQNWETHNLDPNTTSINVNLVSQSTTFTLTALGSLSDQGNQAINNITATALPTINSFSGTTEIYYKQASQQGEYAWAVDAIGYSQVKLYSTGNAFQGGQAVDLSGHISSPLTQPQMLILSAESVNNSLSLTRNLVVSAFKPVVDKYSFDGTASNITASPAWPFVAISDSQNNEIIIADTVDFNPLQKISLDKAPFAIAFSADGEAMIVANTNDNSITPISISLLPDGSFVFTPQSVVALSGSPQSLLVSQDGGLVYVVIDMGKSPGQLVALKKKGANYKVYSNATLQNAPRGIAKTGAYFYVANSGSNSVSIVCADDKGYLVPGTTISQVGNQPTGVALANKGNVLLVACTQDNQLVAIDTKYPNTGSRKTVSVGKQPTQICVTSTGIYGFVNNSEDGSLSLITCSGTVEDVQALPDALIILDSVANDISITPDNLNILAANKSSNILNVISLNTYEASKNPIELVDLITSIAVAPDNKQVFVWQNPMLGNDFTPGIISYLTTPGTTQSTLGDYSIISCVFSPVKSREAAYALSLNNGNLITVNTETVGVFSSTILPLPSAQHKPLALGISDDGNILFVAITDASNNVALLILDYTPSKWVLRQTLSLYQATNKPNFMLIEVSNDGKIVLVIDKNSSQIQVVQAKDNQYTLKSALPSAVGACAATILPYGTAAYIITAKGMEHNIVTIDLVNLVSHVVTISKKGYFALSGIVSSPDGRRLYCCDANSGVLRVIDPSSLRILQTISLSDGSGKVQYPIAVAMANDGSSIYVVNNMSGNMSIIQQIQMTR